MVQLTLPARARCAGVAAKVVLPWRVGGGEGSDRKPSNTGEKHQDGQELPRAVGWRVSSGDPPPRRTGRSPWGWVIKLEVWQVGAGRGTGAGPGSRNWERASEAGLGVCRREGGGHGGRAPPGPSCVALEALAESGLDRRCGRCVSEVFRKGESWPTSSPRVLA